MANTYTLISSNTLSTTTASVTFSSIPQTYNDLVLKVSARADTVDTNVNIYIQFNGNTTGTNYNGLLYGYYSSANNYNQILNRNQMDYGLWASGANILTNMFAANEVYIPNYTSSMFKVLGAQGIIENNSSTGWALMTSSLWRQTAAITTILMQPYSGSFLAGSTFWLYGIKNS
jgi:hypothetical protein